MRIHVFYVPSSVQYISLCRNAILTKTKNINQLLALAERHLYDNFAIFPKKILND